jgi:hypothetical protein
MAKGILNNQDVLSKRQLDTSFSEGLKNDADNCVELNNEQETLKAKLKEKTEQLDAAMLALEKKAGGARKIIKLDMPQSSWREFGINDKQ